MHIRFGIAARAGWQRPTNEKYGNNSCSLQNDVDVWVPRAILAAISWNPSRLFDQLCRMLGPWKLLQSNQNLTITDCERAQSLSGVFNPPWMPRDSTAPQRIALWDDTKISVKISWICITQPHKQNGRAHIKFEISFFLQNYIWEELYFFNNRIGDILLWDCSHQEPRLPLLESTPQRYLWLRTELLTLTTMSVLLDHDKHGNICGFAPFRDSQVCFHNHKLLVRGIFDAHDLTLSRSVHRLRAMPVDTFRETLRDQYSSIFAQATSTFTPGGIITIKAKDANT